MTDDHARGERRDGDGKGFKTKASLAFNEPVKQEMSRLKEMNGIAQDRQRPRSISAFSQTRPFLFMTHFVYVDAMDR